MFIPRIYGRGLVPIQCPVMTMTDFNKNPKTAKLMENNRYE